MKRRSQRKLAAKRRRGVLMIVILSILVLFALIALTFVVVAGQFRSQAASFARHELTDEQGRELIEQTFRQLLRGTNDTNSPLFDGAICNSLLEDLYGPNWVKGAVSGSPSTSYGPDFISFNATGTFSDRSDYYSGQVLTFLDGPCAFLSTRIVRFEAPSTFHVEAFQPGTGSITTPTSGNNFLINGRPFSGQEGVHANESFDAPNALDPQLAYIPSTTTTYLLTEVSSILPSFTHKAAPAPANTFNSNNVAIPNIDNDRDGFNDSIWIDPLFPIKTAADGRRYKPYVAILCIDQDGRINVNAHGSLAQNHADYNGTANRFWGRFFPTGGASAANVRPRGMGVGPADIDPNMVLGLSSTEQLNFLRERYRSSNPSDQVPGIVGSDRLFRFNIPGLADNFTTYSTTPGNYANPIDLHGRGAYGVDYAGRPITHFIGVGEQIDVPYEMNLVQPNGADSPFTPADLEGVLRYNDGDRNALSQRLLNVTGTSLTASATAIETRRMVTTQSSRIPVPSVPFHIIDRTVSRMGGTYNAANVQKILPFEVLHGGKMDLNRPWGNGTDNSGTGVVDDPTELGTAETVYTDVYTGSPAAPTANYVNGVPGLTSAQGRQLYARNLYCLMMVLLEANYRANFRESITDDNQLREMTARRVAQWAVNVVDFRDADAIMTPFEYDVNPFNGWEPDGIVTESGGVYQPDGSETRLVWGCEHPDAILTESVAFHDRRVRDTDWDDKADATNEDNNPADATRGNKRIHAEFNAADDPMDQKRGDKDLDQVRIPQGSTYFELYATRNVSANNPLYPRELYTADGKLDLAAKDRQSSTYPVWRIAISATHHNGTRAAVSPLTRRDTYPDSTTFQPEAMSMLDSTVQLPIERYVWFTNAATTGFTPNQTSANTFYNVSGSSAQLLPGRYAIIAPRAQTFIGSQPTSSDPTALATGVTTNSDQSLSTPTTGSTNHTFVNSNSTSRYPIPYTNVTAARIEAPLNIICATNSSYDFPIGLNVSEPLPNPSNVSPLRLSDGTNLTNSPYPLPTHTRLGIKDAYGDGTATGKYRDKPLDSEAGRPLKDGDILDTGTVQNFRTAFLQRLANPLIPWNAASNPYITVDWIPIDLTVFNGEDREPSDWATKPKPAADSKFDTDDDTAVPAEPQFTSRERDGAPSGTISGINIWAQSTRLRTVADLKIAGRSPYTYDNAAELECFQRNLWHSLGYLNGESYTGVGVALRGLRGQFGPLPTPKGEPGDPFVWLTWNDRPFTSHMDLLLVPASSPSRLLHEVTPTQISPTVSVSINMYDMPAAQLIAPHGHLLNFLHDTNTNSSGALRVPYYYRILDFVEVSSRFNGTRHWFSPTNTLPSYSPPFNSLSAFRDPGLLNINTITGDGVWRAFDGSPTANTAYSTLWSSVDVSRRGTLDSYGRFSNPYRSAWTSDSVSSIQRTLLRANTNEPLFGRVPVSIPSGVARHAEPHKHAFFFYQIPLKMGNLFTTQSNVYAVWLTVGYFEIDPSTGAPLRELNSDTGEVTRHRGFYLLDRSIPVAYERGQDHNVDKAILLRRYIE